MAVAVAVAAAAANREVARTVVEEAPAKAHIPVQLKVARRLSITPAA